MKISQSEARGKLWQIGVIAPWYLKNYQLDILKLLLRQRFPFVECSRRIGKTTSDLIFVQEFLRRKESGVWRWCEPWKYQAREIVIPEMDRVQESCPDGLKFRYYKTDSFFELPTNGSRIYLRGVNEDKGESARGSFADGITADEFGSWREATYIINEILLPQLLSTNGPLHKLSTPPKNLGHIYYEEKELAARQGRFIQKTVLDSVGELYTKEQILAMCEAVGGPNSPAWLREFMCEPVSDPEMLIVPEWSESENVVEDDYPRPEFFVPYVGGDSGQDDNTAILFGWYDFTKNEVVIDQEYVNNGKTTKEIIDSAKIIEQDLWGNIKPKKRVYDANKQLIFDIFSEHKWPVEMPQKEDKIASIHELRTEVGARRFKVKKRCSHLTRQMKVGMWKDERKTDFERTDGLGHLDAISAALYFNRSVDRKHNPIPAYYGANPSTHYIPANIPSSHTNQTDVALAKLFGRRR